MKVKRKRKKSVKKTLIYKLTLIIHKQLDIESAFRQRPPGLLRRRMRFCINSQDHGGIPGHGCFREKDDLRKKDIPATGVRCDLDNLFSRRCIKNLRQVAGSLAFSLMRFVFGVVAIKLLRFNGSSPRVYNSR